MKRYTYPILFFLFLNYFKCFFIVAGSISIENYSYKEGLNTSGVNSVYKDSKGFLWICANNGLFRYDGYSFKNINSLVQGSLKYETFCITEDKNHNFWIGTSGKGLMYYNTHSGKLFRLKMSEGNNCRINKILFHNNKIWLATNTGLMVTDQKEEIDVNTVMETKVLWPDPLRKNLQMNVINCIYARPDSKSLWIGTNSFLYELIPDSFQFRLINSHYQNSIRWISDYGNGNIIVSSWDGGVFVVNPEKHKLDNDFFADEMNKFIGSKRVKSALIDKQGRCWIATFGEGLYIFTREKNGKTTYKNFRNEEDQTNTIKSNFLNQICLDNSGIAWISMAEGGLSKFFYQQNNFRYYNFPEDDNHAKPKEILSLSQSSDKNKFWVTFNRNEIDIFDSRTFVYRQFTGTSTDLKLQKDKVSLAYQDKKGNLWIVYSRIGLYVVPSKAAASLVNGSNIRTIMPVDANNLLLNFPGANSYIDCFYEDAKGRLWIGSWGSVYVVEIMDGFLIAQSPDQLKNNARIALVYSDDRKDEYGFTISPVNSIIEIGKQTFWLGTRDGGIIKLEETSDLKFVGKDLDLNEKLPGNNINCFYRDKDQVLWIGTNSGLCYVHLNNLSDVKTINGISSESISNIAEDNSQNIWISTSYGVSRINRNDLSVTNLYNTENEELNQYITNAVSVTPQGKIWFSTHESLVTPNSDSIEMVQLPAPIYFTDIRINSKTITPLEKYRGVHVIENELNESKVINVPYGSVLNIEFASINYLNQERILYAYRIGSNHEWIALNPGQRSLNLPNMNPGEYTLSIKVANSPEESESRSIKINYLNPFWRSKIAIIIYVFIMLVLLFTYRRLMIQRILQRSLIEKERYERKKIEELDKMKSEFFSNISHEFRTPLSLIISPLEKLIKQEDISDKNKNNIRLVLKSSDRLLKLTNELMDFSKIEKNLLKPDFQLYDIVSLTREICLLFNNLADARDIEFKTNHSFDRLDIPIDKGMIEKILFNLLSNAFKYTPIHGIIMVNLSKVQVTQREFVKISVINTGAGISRENLNRIFDRYYQVNNVQNQHIAGTGIGLALVKNFVELHKGKVEAKSEPNMETCFDIYLPVIQEDFTSGKKGKMKDPIYAERTFRFADSNEAGRNQADKAASQYRVLVIEDEDDIRDFIVGELSSEYKVIAAKDGIEGLNMAREVIPDLIITDIIMPLLSGLELCNELKNQMITSHIPIIILSAKAGIAQQIEGLEMGADVYLIKPFNMDYLKAQILSLINLKQAVYSRYLKENNLYPQESMVNRLDEEFMKKVLIFIEENITNADLNVDQLANYVSLSKVQTYRKVKAITGLSIVEFIRVVRLKKAAQLVLENRLNFSEIAFETGFSTPSYFSKCFHDHFGKSPSKFSDAFSEKSSNI